MTKWQGLKLKRTSCGWGVQGDLPPTAKEKFYVSLCISMASAMSHWLHSLSAMLRCKNTVLPSSCPHCHSSFITGYFRQPCVPNLPRKFHGNSRPSGIHTLLFGEFWDCSHLDGPRKKSPVVLIRHRLHFPVTRARNWHDLEAKCP